MNPYVFIVGCPRSGTTLLRRIADAHSELAVIGELHWLPRWWEWRIALTPEGTVTQGVLDMLLADRRFHKLEVPISRIAELIEADPPKHYADFVSHLFDLHGRVRKKALVGEKTPGYVRYLTTLHSLWPHAKVVHLIRDGRDVALSVLDWDKAERNAGRFPTWEEDPVTTAALYWEWNVRLGREAGGLLGPGQYHELRYESFVSDPERECQRLCDFLRLPYDPAMLRFNEGRTRSEPGLSAKRAWQPVATGLRRWREQMKPDALERFEAVAGDLLEELAYGRGTTSASGRALGRAAGLRDVFGDFARLAGWQVPMAWDRVAA
jgi:Sulfotransferase family